MCAKKVRSGLQKVDAIHDLTIVMKPASIHFSVDTTKESIQDLIRDVRACGSEFDARLMLKSDADDERLSEALRSVDGVRTAGSQDKRGIRLLTFFLDKKTYYGDLVTAATNIGAKVSAPMFETEKPGS